MRIPQSANAALQRRINEAAGILSMYTTPGAVIRVFSSGGKDSAVAAHIAANHPQFRGVAHVRTKTGPASERHSDTVKQLATQAGWDYIEASPATTLPMLVAGHGCAGPAAHTYMYRYLKERPFMQLIPKARGKAKRLIGVSGIRKAESAFRNQNAIESTIVSKSFWWVNPLLNWSDQEVYAYVQEFELIVPDMQHSLDCFCGAYATPDERELIQLTDPEQFEYIQFIEAVATTARQIQLLEARTGFRKPKAVIPEAFCKWGHGLNKSTRAPNEAASNMPEICHACHNRLNADGNAGANPDTTLKVALLKREKEIA